MTYPLPPDTRAVGTGNPPGDMNMVVDALTGMGAGNWIRPSGDASGVADTAAINAVAQSGKVALLAAATYYVANLLPDSLGGIAGAGPASVLQAVSGTTGYAIALKTPASTYQVTLSDFTLIPNTGSLGGIQVDNTGYTPPGGAPTSPLHVLDNIYVENAGGDAYHFGANARALKVTRCRQDNALGYGFYLDAGCTDSRFSDCTSANSASDAFYVKGWVNNFSNCRAGLAGYTGGTPNTTGIGWNILGGYNTFTSCSSQQASLHGWQLAQGGGSACNYNTVTGCEADTNNQGQTTGVGFYVNGAAYCTVTGCTGQNNGGVGSGQVWGIQLAGTLAGCYVQNNAVAGTSGGTTGISGAYLDAPLRDTYLRSSSVYGESIPRSSMLNTSANLGSGTLMLTAVALPAGITVGHLQFASSSTAGVTLAHWWFGLYDSGLSQLAVTADQASAAWTANTYMSLAVATIASGASATFTTTYTGLYYVGVMINAATVPTLVGGAHASLAVNQQAPVLTGSSDTGQTTIPGFPHTATALTATGTLLYAAVAA